MNSTKSILIDRYEQSQAYWEAIARDMHKAGHPMAGFAMERANANKLWAMQERANNTTKG